MTLENLDIKRALSNPKEIFGTPEQVLANPRLDRESKCAILKSWEQDARELAVAEEEGMAGGEQDMLQRVLRALDSVSDGTVDERGTTTKQGGGTRAKGVR